MEIIHFNSPEERMRYIKGNYEEIILPSVEEKTEEAVEKPKKAKKSAKKSKKEGENGRNKAE